MTQSVECPIHGSLSVQRRVRAQLKPAEPTCTCEPAGFWPTNNAIAPRGSSKEGGEKE